MHSVSEVGGGGLGDTAEPFKRGFEAIILDKSGREPCGIGGGVPLGAAVLDLGLPNPSCLGSFLCAGIGGGGNVFRIGRLTLESSPVPFVSVCTADGRRDGSRGTGGSSSS